MTVIPDRFNIRVYGILINSKQEVLVSDEQRYGQRFTKFPGGGLEFGEGVIDCLKREYIEELNQEVEVVEPFYITDFYQQSAFNQRDQLVSIYYLVNPLGSQQYTTSEMPFDFKTQGDELEAFRFVPLENIKETTFTFPIDQHVGKLLKSTFVK